MAKSLQKKARKVRKLTNGRQREGTGRHCGWIHEWERLRGFSGEEKDGAEEEGIGEVAWLRKAIIRKIKDFCEIIS